MKISTLSIWAASIALTMTMFTSCDCRPGCWGPDYYDDWGYDHGGSGADRVVTVALDGVWRGYTHWFNPWEGHNYTTSEIEFVKQTSTYGTGYWVDYYDDFPSDYYIFNNIEWQVYDGYVRIHFIQENSYVTIYEYSLNDYYFDGYINDNGNKVEFQLDRITRPYYDWDWYIPYGTTTESAPAAKSTTDSLTSKRTEALSSALASGKLTLSRGSIQAAK